MSGPYVRFVKRALDLIIAIPAFVVLLPFLFLVGAAIRLSSRGPAIFRQVRLGRFGRPFLAYKFRTMHVEGVISGPIAASLDDERVTRLGWFLRDLKFDELPQIWNVIRGDMSLVGPRPLVPEQVDTIDRRLWHLRPGITSFASVCYRREAELLNGVLPRDEFYRQRILPAKDVLNRRYAERVSLLLDLKILLLTAFLLFFPGKSREADVQVGQYRLDLYSRPFQIVIDFMIFVLSLKLAYWLRFEGRMPDYIQAQMAWMLMALPLARWAVNQLAGIYDQIWRHFSMRDGFALANSALVSTLVLWSLRVFLTSPAEQFPYLRVPFGVIGMEFLLTVFGLVGVRALRRFAYELSGWHRPLLVARRKRVLVAGASSQGIALIQNLMRYPEAEVTGFVDDDPRKIGRRIVGKRVLGTCLDIPKLVRAQDVDLVAVCFGPENTEALGRVNEICRNAEVPSVVMTDSGFVLDLDRTTSDMSPAEAGPGSQVGIIPNSQMGRVVPNEGHDVISGYHGEGVEKRHSLSPAGTAERRRDKRVSVNVPVVLSFRDGPDQVVWTRNLSSRGLCFRSQQTLEEGERYSLGASEPGSPSLIARILWRVPFGTRNEGLYGARIEVLDPETSRAEGNTSLQE